MVFDNVNRVPIYEKPYASQFFVLGLNHQGCLKNRFDKQQKEFHQHDFVMIPPGHVMEILDYSDDYLVSLLVISPSFLQNLKHIYPFYFEHVDYRYNSVFHLSDEQYEGMQGHFMMLQAISQLSHPDRDELLVRQLEIGTQLMEIYLHENGLTALKTTSSNISKKVAKCSIMPIFFVCRPSILAASSRNKLALVPMNGLRVMSSSKPSHCFAIARTSTSSKSASNSASPTRQRSHAISKRTQACRPRNTGRNNKIIG